MTDRSQQSPTIDVPPAAPTSSTAPAGQAGRSEAECLFGERLRRARKLARLTQRSLARELLVHPLSVGRWERGQQLPDVAIVARMVAVLGTSADHLLGVDGNREPTESIGGLTAEELTLILAYRRLDRRGQLGVRRLVRWELNGIDSEEG